MIWIAAAFMLLCALVGAKLEGEADGARSLTGKPVEHKRSALWRVVIGVAIAILVTALAGARWWNVFPLLGIAFGGFNPLFRWTLNSRRKMDWRYVSPSNWYDALFTGDAYPAWHSARYGTNKDWTKHIHSSGVKEYAVEFVTLALSVFMLILTNP